MGFLRWRGQRLFAWGQPFLLPVGFFSGWRGLGTKTKRWRRYGKKGFTYKSQYAVVVICSDEEDQKHTYEKLQAEGYRLKVVAV